MLATLVDGPFDDDDWLFEVKWDGFRALAFIQDKKVELKSRNKLNFNNKFPEIVEELKKIKSTVILDGEVVVIDAKGKSHFQLIQNYKSQQNNTLCYYVFDILYKDGTDLRDLPLIERKNILKKYLEQLSLPMIRYSDHVVAKGKAFFKAAVKENLEGIIGKKLSSTYKSKRSHDWVKIKSLSTQEIIICGFTEPRGSRQKFGALIAGVYDKKNELVYAGHVGGGFNDALLKSVYEKLKPLITTKCPFKSVLKVNSPVTWVKPLLIAEATFTEWTKDNNMRHPIFKGLRIDKDNPKDVKKEIPEKVQDEKPRITSKNKDLKLTHLEKLYWPKENITKGDLIAYYEKIAPYILPYLKNRPIMLHRYPDGIEGKDFYQKDLNFNPPDWIKTFELSQEGKINNYLIINDVKSLLYAINLGSIDLHPFLSHTTSLEHPDYCVIDLDPHDISFDKVIEVAIVLHELLDKIKIKHYCKTSGGKGLHILIPLKAKYDYEQSRQFAEILCLYLNKQFPELTSMERSPQKRSKKIYLDCLQNRLSQSIAAPYSVRPRPHANVSTPLLWEEVNADLEIAKFNIHTVPDRLTKMGDILKPLLGSGVNIQKALSTLAKECPEFKR
jgi:bifunctional non-homologous end joining protein LigD